MNKYKIKIPLLLSFLLLSFIVGTASAEQVVVTSGRVVYDAFGRAVKTYHPTVDSDTVVLFSISLDTVRPTVTVYDELDRPERITQQNLFIPRIIHEKVVFHYKQNYCHFFCHCNTYSSRLCCN